MVYMNWGLGVMGKERVIRGQMFCKDSLVFMKV